MPVSMAVLLTYNSDPHALELFRRRRFLEIDGATIGLDAHAAGDRECQ